MNEPMTKAKAPDLLEDTLVDDLHEATEATEEAEDLERWRRYCDMLARCQQRETRKRERRRKREP